jgi:hypothetical protein
MHKLLLKGIGNNKKSQLRKIKNKKEVLKAAEKAAARWNK